jgi:hypothetical protein
MGTRSREYRIAFPAPRNVPFAADLKLRRKCLIFALVLVLVLSEAVLVIVIEFRPFDYEHEHRALLALSTSTILRSQRFSPSDPA